MALQALKLDSNKNIIYNPASLVIRQGESGIQLRVTMKENYSPISSLSSAYLIFEAQKPDGTIIKDEDQSRFVKNQNGFYYTLNPATFQAVGNVKGHFIVETGSITDTTSDFTIKVLSRDGKAQVSSDYISKAELVIANVNDRIEQVNTLFATLTDQTKLTNANLSAKTNKFIEDTQTTVNANIKTLTDNLNQLKNTFNSNITSAEGVFNSKKSEIDDWFTKSQQDYTTQKQSIDSEWTAKKAEKDNDWLKLKASYDNKIAGLTTQYQASVDQQKKQLSGDLATFKSQLKSQLDSTQSTINQLKNTDVPAISKKLDDIRADIDKIDLDSVKRRADDAYTLAQSVNDSVSNKADKSGVTALSGKVDTKASQSDLNGLGERVTTAESDIRNLRNSKPDLSGYYQKSETYKRDEIDNKNLATQNQAVEIAKQYTDSKSSLEILEKNQLRALNKNKKAIFGKLYAAYSSDDFVVLGVGKSSGEVSALLGTIDEKIITKTLYTGEMRLPSFTQNVINLDLLNWEDVKNGGIAIRFSKMGFSDSGRYTSDLKRLQLALDKVLTPGCELKIIDSKFYIFIPYEQLKNENIITIGTVSGAFSISDDYPTQLYTSGVKYTRFYIKNKYQIGMTSETNPAFPNASFIFIDKIVSYEY